MTDALRDLAAHYAGVRERLGIRRTRAVFVRPDPPPPPVEPEPEPESAPPDPPPTVRLRPIPRPHRVDHPSGMAVGLTPAEARWQIIRDVEENTGVTFDEMLDAGRENKVVRARRKVASRLRKELGWSYPRIAFLMERDHTSIINLLNPKKERAKHGRQG